MEKRLIEILQPLVADLIDNKIGLEEMVSRIIEKGVLVPPCKVGDKVYQTVLFKDKTGFIVERNVVGFHLGDFPELRGHKRKQYFIVYHETTQSIPHIDIDQLGKTVFLTREEAEQALKGGFEKCPSKNL